MKKVIFGIFAHPDDEAFGPAGALLKETKAGNDLHLIVFTAGDAGMNLDNLPDLSKSRLEEWKKSGGLLGAKSMSFLGYKDGGLNNKIMIEASDKVAKIVKNILEKEPANIEVEFLGFDFSGLSGHIDHIVASRTAALVFYRLQKNDSRLKRIRLFCLPETFRPEHSIDWLYAEAGLPEEIIDETIDARDIADEITNVMRAHHTQRMDCEHILKAYQKNLGLNHFIIKS